MCFYFNCYFAFVLRSFKTYTSLCWQSDGKFIINLIKFFIATLESMKNRPPTPDIDLQIDVDDEM